MVGMAVPWGLAAPVWGLALGAVLVTMALLLCKVSFLLVEDHLRTYVVGVTSFRRAIHLNEGICH